MSVTLLQEWVSRQADERPESTAIVSGETRLGYGELDALSTRIAWVLHAAGCRQGDRVALLMPKSPMAIAALVGIYKADCIYVPLDPSSPATRLTKILRSCETPWILASAATAAVLRELVEDETWTGRVRVGWLDHEPPAGDAEDLPIEFTLADVQRAPSAPLAYWNGAGAPAHILFTSGSTGQPKGVVIGHANVIPFIEWATDYFGMDSSDRVSAHPPLHFDLSFLDIFGTFAAGGELHLVPPELSLLPHKLAAFIRASALTQWFSVPSLLAYMAKFDVVGQGDFPALKRVLWCGEVLPTPALIYWMSRLRHVAFTNLYGPTETTIASSYYTVPKCPADPRSPVPIGRACAGEELLVLDEALRPTRPGGTGDLYISGVGLAQGYWRDPERTGAAFLRHPRRPSEMIYKTGDRATIGADGLVYFLGRTDAQIKSRGYRIELGEIEAALNTLPDLRETAVVAIDSGGFEGALICGAYVPANGTAIVPALLRRQLERLVPGYMIPARWQAFAALPKNANGKVDRRRLQDIFAGGLRTHAARPA